MRSAQSCLLGITTVREEEPLGNIVRSSALFPTWLLVYAQYLASTVWGVVKTQLLQVRDTLGALADRCAALKIDGAALHVSRLLRRDSRGLAVKRITMYSPNWVKSQNRMSSTSNQAWCPLSPYVKGAQPPTPFVVYTSWEHSVHGHVFIRSAPV